MGYLDNDTIVVDAILTKHGRRLLADGFAINPSHFALSDDGVDYTLWNTSSPSGSGGYDDYISKLPMIEAVPDDAAMMHYHLVTLPQNTQYMPVVTLPLSPTTDNSYTLSNDELNDIIHLEPSILNWNDPGATFTFLIMDATPIDYKSHNGTIVSTAGSPAQLQSQDTPFSVTIAGATYLDITDRRVTADMNTSIVIEHDGSGAQITANITVLASDTV